MIKREDLKRKWLFSCSFGWMIGLFLLGMPAKAVEYGSMSGALLPAAETVEKQVSMDISKRVQWVDASNGDAKITLQYASNSGELSVTQEMNVVLIHDKSGSMDVNYGYHLGKVKEGWDKAEKSVAFPILNDKQWSETVFEEGSNIDLESEGAQNYLLRINSPNEYTKKLGVEEGYVEKNGNNIFYQYEVTFNSPCQLDDHYYLMIKEDTKSRIPAWKMVHGKNLYNIQNTDLHHYVKIKADNNGTVRDNALKYIAQGHRVVRVMADSESYYSEKGETKVTEPLYFLDVTTLEQYSGKWMLNTCAREDCRNNDRLVKSQTFMNTLVDNILHLNPANKIAYIPFWGDVPEKGSWKNYMGNAAGDGVLDITDYEHLLNRKEGVDSVAFTSDPRLLQAQINHSFTYHGTNWSSAFQKAIDFLEKRGKEDQEKETLVLFLTDGMPQGTEGQEQDYHNPAISGIKLNSAGELVGGTLFQLKKIEGVTIWAVGVGINELDHTGVRERLEMVNDDGQPFYARYTTDFAYLTTDVLEKINQKYTEKFYATDAFYQDTLGEYFELDTEKIDSSWRILKEDPAAKLIHGVPENVYKLVNQEGQDTGVTKVYAEKTKTVYWYIGTMSNGDYEQDGHQMEIPLKFTEYEKDTAGKDRILPSNYAQFVTYHTTLEPEHLYTVTIDTPKLVYNRKNSEITIRKEVTHPREFPETYRYVCSKKKYTYGVVKEVLGEVQLTIPKGAVSGSTSVKGLGDGTYYIYEVDSENVIVCPEVEEITVNYHPKISTKIKSQLIPASVTASDYGSKDNLDNYLRMGFEGTVSFQKGVELTIVKEIDVSEEVPWWDHGNPTFVVCVKGKDVNNKENVFYHTFEFTKTYVAENSKNGKVSISYTFRDLPVSECYTVEEVRVSRYQLESVEAKLSEGDSVGKIVTDSTNRKAGFYNLQAEVNLKMHPKGVSVILYNRKINEQWFNHTAYIKNTMIE